MGNNKPKSKSNKALLQKRKKEKPALVYIHEKFMENEGIAIYEYARNLGYSVKGASLLLALAANESGYGTEDLLSNAEEHNNFWGIKIGNTSILRQIGTKEEGERATPDMFNTYSYYSDLKNYLKDDNGTLPQMDKAFKSYNTSPNGKHYATWLSNNILKRSTSTALNTISDEITDLQARLQNDESEISPNAPYLSKVAPYLLSNDNRLGVQAIDELQKKINDLQHIQQELETGKADTNYFLTSPKLTWTNKKDNPASNSNAPYMPPPFDAELPGAPTVGMPSRGLMNGYNFGDNNFSGMPSATPVSHPVKAKKSAKSGGVSVNIHPNYNISPASRAVVNVHDEVMAVLTSAIADSKIGTDV